jgi:Relaxase/Mobilisation nuclease domain
MSGAGQRGIVHRTGNTGGARPLLDIASYGRRGPGERIRLSQDEIDLIRRTVTRTPEVMVKVLTRGGQSGGSVRRHLSYLSRKGELELETDDGERIAGSEIEKALVDEWDLDLDSHRSSSDLGPRKRQNPPKLVHKVLFSMPPGTSSKRVLEAVRNFAREEFGLQHRYLMVLHTDEPHPHVHMVIKAVSEQGVRLNIRRETLRSWRREFARHLRDQGVAANATERAVRGETKAPVRDGSYRAAIRGDSQPVNNRIEAAPSQRRANGLENRQQDELRETQKRVAQGWSAVSEFLQDSGELPLAIAIARFVSRMDSPPTNDRQLSDR